MVLIVKQVRLVSNSNTCITHPANHLDPERLARYDIVVTTYSTLSSELGNKVKEAKNSKARSKKDQNSDGTNDSDDSDSARIVAPKKRAPIKKKAPLAALHAISYWRVVLGLCSDSER